MNILCSIDPSFMHPLKTLLFSLADTQREDIIVYLPYISLTKEDLKDLDAYCNFLGIKLYPIEIRDSYKNDLQDIRKGKASINGVFPIETYLRLFAGSYIPKSVHKCLYLDADIIVQGNIRPFYDFNLGTDVALLAILDPIYYYDDLSNLKSQYLQKCNLPDDFKYVNSGVLLMNLDYMRNAPEFKSNNIINFLKSNPDYLDQDVINTLFYSKTFVTTRIQYNTPAFLDSSYLDKADIIHYLNVNPWSVIQPGISFDVINRWNRVDNWVNRIDRVIIK